MSTLNANDIPADIPAQRKLTGGVLTLLAGLAAIGALSTNITLPSFPSMAAEFGVSARDMGLTLSSFFVAFAIGQLLVGPLSDRYGRKKLVLGGLIVFLAGTALCAAADTLETMIIGRVVQALGVCAASVLSRAIARDLFDGDALSRALSLTMIAMAAAPGFSPLLGSTMDATLGWRSTFLLVGLSGGALVLYYLFGMGETHPADRRAAHTARTVAVAYGRLATDRRFIMPALAVSLIVGGLYAFFGAAPAILIGLIGLSPVQLGLFFAATVFIVFGAGLLAPRLAHRWEATKVATAGIAIALAGGAILLAGGGTPSLPLFTAAIVVFLFGMGLVNPLGTAIALQPFGKQAGLASALLGFLQMACAALATALSTALPYDSWTALGVILTVTAAIALLLFAGIVLRGSR
ncbi:multidrug effflux MFS transporter [Oceanibaculum pacificum]|uniref:Bcr/CflA family efflux transporter n=1 Tax=Oceanibaculum pacificum TaxID=580166 RepID=A0A154VS05_9PROT|nr:multidrug effflux MFS transporter [Oceanibaculum pacificum]KZD04093.1 multidrug transporter CflA [Oceanibaculum pacificum]